MNKNNIFLLFVCLFSLKSWSNDTIAISPNLLHADHNLRLLLVNVPVNTLNIDWPDEKLALEAGDLYIFSESVDTLKIGTPYIVSNENNKDYILYFTELPIIKISISDTINAHTRIPSSFELYQNDSVLHSYMGIKYRGASSLILPKKSLGIRFWTDSIGTSNRDVSILGLRSHQNWALQAMYREPLRLNNKVCHKLWTDIHTPYYISQEPDAINGVRLQYAEVFVNDEYRGVYGVSEMVDRKQLKLKKHDGNMRGELYKGDTWGASTFHSLPAYDNQNDVWGGFEFSYPDDHIDWQNIYGFVDFVINSPISYFYDHNASHFQQSNAIDYFIFLNLMRATDNTGKNIFIGRYDADEPYFYIPWDLDGTFGIIWDGSRENITDDILTNGFYDKLLTECKEGGFWKEAQTRWNLLRDSLFTHENLMKRFTDEASFLDSNAVYAREKMAWPEFSYDSTYLAYTSAWLHSRLLYLDYYFSRTCSLWDINENESSDSQMFIYPNPANETIMISSKTEQNNLSVTILDAVGKTVLKKEQVQTSEYIGVNTLVPGIYWVHIRNVHLSEVKKIIVNQ